MLDPAPRLVLDPGARAVRGRPHARRTRRSSPRSTRHTMDVIARADGARRLPGAAGARTCSTSSTGTWSRRSSRKGRQAAAVRRRGRAGHRRGVGHRQGLRGRAARARRGGGRARPRSGDRDAAPAPGFPRARRRRHRPRRRSATRCGAAVDAFGGLDMLILNAGIFPGRPRIDELAPGRLAPGDAASTSTPTCVLIRASRIRCSNSAPRGGRRGRHRLQERARAGPGRRGLLGVEGGAHPARARRGAGVGRGRHPRQRRSTPTPCSTPALWTDEVLAARAAHYGMTRRGVQAQQRPAHVEVGSRDVAELVAEMCGAAVREDHRRADPGRRRQRPRDLVRPPAVVSRGTVPRGRTFITSRAGADAAFRAVPRLSRSKG